MIVLEFFLILLVVSIAAGALGSIVGIGGGLIVIPILTLFLGVDIHYAIGASIVSIIATSSGAAATYVKDRITNLRIGMFLETATTTGAIIGAAIAAYLSATILEAVFGTILIISLVPLVRKIGQEYPPKQQFEGLAKKLNLRGDYIERDGTKIEYNAANPGKGLAGMIVAGLISGLLGIGSGTFKVLSMDLTMRLPMKVSTTTSNFMIGVTAAASAGIYFARGDVNPLITAPVALGILVGASAGTHLLVKAKNTAVRKIFAIVLAASAIEMIIRALGF
ncbi:MAG TPA: sulfite exporter TauE/SafE family protein [Candidatus Bathyarchaeia archaeon]|nr:sulfite exporter TauE/SafE family protein [Candidatus Bathyarchaeia archaeon]